MRVCFRERFCEQFRCSAAEFERRLFWRCLFPHARIPAWFIWRAGGRQFFQEDLAFIRDVASAVTHREVIGELNRFHGRNVREKRLLRKMFAIRLSGHRIRKLSRRLFRGKGGKA